MVPMSLRANASKADVIQLAGIVAIRHCGGPNIPFKSGRQDNNQSSPHVVGRLPDPLDRISRVKQKFARMGFTPVEMAVLISGGHSMGGRTDHGFFPFDATPV